MSHVYLYIIMWPIFNLLTNIYNICIENDNDKIHWVELFVLFWNLCKLPRYQRCRNTFEVDYRSTLFKIFYGWQSHKRGTYVLFTAFLSWLECIKWKIRIFSNSLTPCWPTSAVRFRSQWKKNMFGNIMFTSRPIKRKHWGKISFESNNRQLSGEEFSNNPPL